MKILAVDTSSTVAAVAVAENTKLLGEFIINHKKTHSQKLMPMIKNILDSLELSPAEIDLYAASSGPGSFTGLRIGVTAVKAMAFAAGKPVVSVPTLDALAYNVPETEALICPMMDARNNQVFTAIYKYEKGEQIKITEYMGIPVLELIDMIKGKNQKAVFIGDGVEVHRELLQIELGGKSIFLPNSLSMNRGSSVAQIAYLKAIKGFTENCFEMAPFYLRKSQAEREYEKKQCKMDA
ncbi:MAG: tRNA (adenosine(37)-N6)-threonylcarbamoyltransferase complex dimerization subunit type 1 TsaB [Clostridia bacterium]|nr:tRNA (adenosine(37)-N6)-threonylcarbamoyltransferase complex dimerization subunit type 1 TsaB [Clostridia bacterium]